MTEQAQPRRVSVARWIAIAAVTAVLVEAVVVVALAINVAGTADVRAEEHARQTALTAANRFAVDFTTYDYRHLGTGFARNRSAMSPAFSQAYARTTKGLTKTLTDYRSVSDSKLRSSGVARATVDRATVIAFVDQTVKNRLARVPRTDRIRMTLSLVRRGERWLVDDVSLV